MQNYEPDLVRRLGDAIYESMAEIWKRRGQAELMTLELVEHSNEEMQHLERNKELVKIGGPEVLKSVALLHRQLEHPNGSKLIFAKTRHTVHCKSAEVNEKERIISPVHPSFHRGLSHPRPDRQDQWRHGRTISAHPS